MIVVCFAQVLCIRIRSVQRHFQITEQFKFEISDVKSGAIKNAVPGIKKQSGILSQAVGSEKKATECKYKIAQRVALKGKPF